MKGSDDLPSLAKLKSTFLRKWLRLSLIPKNERFGSDKASVEVIISKLKVEYDKFKSEGSACEECLLKLVQKDLGAKTDAIDISKGLKTKTFEQFLYTAFVGSCEDKEIEVDPRAKMNMFPKFKETAKYQALIDQIRKVLSTGRSVQLDAICPFLENGKCLGGHSAVIKGYRRICKKNNKKDCRDVIQLHNSWDEDWQKRNDDGGFLMIPGRWAPPLDRVKCTLGLGIMAESFSKNSRGSMMTWVVPSS